MSTGPDPRVERAARDIAEGRDVRLDVTPGDTEETAALIANLRTVEQVARIHRQMLDARGESVKPAPGPPPLFHWGPFEVLEPIGSGSFGEVFRARDATLGREVALKLRRADEAGSALASSRWLDEARRLAAVRHPNVVHVYGAAVHDGRAGIWMELIPGVTLAKWLASQGSMGWKESCLVGMELCAALAAVHAAGLIHNDVKLENVMRSGSALGGLGGSGRIVLMDLGAGGRLTPVDMGGIVLGTPSATAPEVLLGGTSSMASDLWSLGALIYRLVTGVPPFEAKTPAELVERARGGEVRPLRELRPELPVAFVTAIERALAPEAAARFASAADFERALARSLELPMMEPAGGRPIGPGRTLVLAAVVLGVLGFAIVAALRSGRSLEPLAVRGTGDQKSPAASAPSAEAGNVPPAPDAAEPPAVTPLVRARLVRSAASGAETLENGDLVVPGDQLALEVDASETLWFYALNEDRSGAVSALFPVEGLDLGNPLPPGHHRLPGPRGGRAFDWQVTSTGGDETFLFIASSKRLREVEERVAASKPAAEGNAVQVPEGGSSGDHRGVSGLAPAREIAGDTGTLQALQRNLEHDTGSHVWLRRIELRNPGR